MSKLRRNRTLRPPFRAIQRPNRSAKEAREPSSKQRTTAEASLRSSCSTRRKPLASAVSRFKNELTFGERNQHKNVITVRDHGVDTTGPEPTPFYVMPFFEESLRALMDSGIKHEQVLPLFAQCLDGVEAAHLQGVVHRDLKPENILYDVGTNNVVVADFGVAEFAQEELSRSLRQSQRRGSPTSCMPLPNRSSEVATGAPATTFLLWG